jgi:adenylate cyclase class IV
MKWKFENIDIIFSCHEDDFERTSNYSRNKLNTNDRIIIIDGANIDGNDSTNPESDILESSEDIVNTDKHKPRRKAVKVSDMPTILDNDDSIIE